MSDVQEDQIPDRHITDLVREKPVGFRVTASKRYLVYTYQGRSLRLCLDGWVVVHPIDLQTAFEILQRFDVTFYEGDVADWAYAYGYEWPARGEDPKTRRATRAVWHYHKAMTKRMMQLFEADFELFMGAEINDQEHVEE